MAPPPHHPATAPGANLIQAIVELREFRKTQLFRATGHNSFRGWSVATFGERLGVWLDEIL